MGSIDLTADSSWKSIYRIGGLTALLAVVFAVVQVSIEVIGITTVGLPPTTTEAWFGLLRTNKLLGLTELTMFQIPIFVLLIPTFLGLYFAHRQTHQGIMAAATILALVGTSVYLATNTVFSMLSLSDQYATATSDTERSSLLAAGKALQAMSVSSVDVGLSIISAAGLVISIVMLRGGIFSRKIGYTGIFAAVMEVAYYPSLIAPSIGIFLLEISGSLFIIWIVLAGVRLYQMSI